MQVLIVESSPELGKIWQRHLERQGMTVVLVGGQEDAITYLHDSAPDLIVMDLILEEGSAFAIADYANYRYPDTRVIFTTNASFFSDGSIFQHVANACAFLPKQVDPDDLSAMVAYYGKEAS
ncbi:response regulator transcription factor [Celeribacter neptunius]|uniref:Response regulator receiver domain-containing protein n=1 Tax=Celeribacter neptunius TaxID=588602 RepID=A0A1I3X2I3_9RHOB|nr:response regulator [Celeribacter neptunius]SFK13407.1 Response regulator receiver domain-containing protein [Celeribacter neptunius]